MKPVQCPPEFLRPLPKSMQGVACATCDRSQARWEVRAPKQEPILSCSTCFLYDSFWGRPLRKDIDALIVEVEASLGRMFERDPSARLVKCEDADRILGSIALSSRLFKTHDRVQGIRR